MKAPAALPATDQEDRIKHLPAGARTAFQRFQATRDPAALDPVILAILEDFIPRTPAAPLAQRSRRIPLPNHDHGPLLTVTSTMVRPSLDWRGTAIPLLCFSHATRTLSLTTLGILQFIGPTLQFLIGWGLYGEEMNALRLISFGLIWTAVAIYAADALSRRNPRPAM